MKSRTHSGPSMFLWSWLGPESWYYWNVRRVTSRYLLMVPNEKNTTFRSGRDIDSHRVYILIRWPEDCRCEHPRHPGTLCRDEWCMCDLGDPLRDEDGEYVP